MINAMGDLIKDCTQPISTPMSNLVKQIINIPGLENLPLIHGRETEEWTGKDYEKNWQHTPLKFVNNDFFAGILLNYGITDYISALEYIFNYKGKLPFLDVTATNYELYRLNMECSTGLGMILQYIMYKYFGREKYNYLITGINRTILRDDFAKVINDTYTTREIAQNVITGEIGIQHPLIWALWYVRDKIIESDMAKELDKSLEIGNCIFAGCKETMIESPYYKLLDEQDKKIVDKMDINGFKGLWGLVLDKIDDKPKIVAVTSLGVKYSYGIHEIYMHNGRLYDNYFKTSSYSSLLSEEGKKLVDEYIEYSKNIKKYIAHVHKINEELLKNLVYGKRFDTELFKFALHKASLVFTTIEKIYAK